jgi:hypothetical protein
MFSADRIATCPEDVRFGVFRKYTCFVIAVKWLTKEREVCQKMEYRVSQWRKGHPCLNFSLPN